MKNLLKLFLIIFLFASCMEKRTQDPNETYKFWSGSEPTDEVKILNGKYWESSHFTKEYIMFLEMKTSPKYLKEFVELNNLKIYSSSEINLPNDSPDWFLPKPGMKTFVPSSFSQGSIYFLEMETGYMLMYEIQL